MFSSPDQGLGKLRMRGGANAPHPLNTRVAPRPAAGRSFGHTMFKKMPKPFMNRGTLSDFTQAIDKAQREIIYQGSGSVKSPAPLAGMQLKAKAQRLANARPSYPVRGFVTHFKKQNLRNVGVLPGIEEQFYAGNRPWGAQFEPDTLAEVPSFHRRPITRVVRQHFNKRSPSGFLRHNL